MQPGCIAASGPCALAKHPGRRMLKGSRPLLAHLVCRARLMMKRSGHATAGPSDKAQTVAALAGPEQPQHVSHMLSRPSQGALLVETNGSVWEWDAGSCRQLPSAKLPEHCTQALLAPQDAPEAAGEPALHDPTLQLGPHGMSCLLVAYSSTERRLYKDGARSEGTGCSTSLHGLAHLLGASLSHLASQHCNGILQVWDSLGP